MLRKLLCVALVGLLTASAHAEWRIASTSDNRQPPPKNIPTNAETIKPGDKWPNDNKFRWLVNIVTIPATLDGRATAGWPIGMRFNCGDGGEIHVDGVLQSRFDNDHPALIVLAERAKPGQRVRVDVLIYGKVQGGDSFGEAEIVFIEPSRAVGKLTLNVHPKKSLGPVPNGLIGMSQGGGLADYEEATARKLREGGFKWFRMDNILTSTVKKDPGGKFTYDFTDLDKRVDFITDMGAEPIFAVSYMPIPFDAIENHERQSAPKDYGLWEDLCYRAAKHCLDRGKRVPWWEVWNEVNAGWLKPGPEDTGSEPFKKMYQEATGRQDVDHDVVRRFEAYCKLYRATARGVLRADPKAKIGGPALASGPFDEGPGVHGKGFARGLMLFCQQEGLPLNFVSWHEYFQPSDVIAREGDTVREYLKEFPDLEKQVESLMITEWNEAWWTNRPMDHEIGAAWCADGMIRAIIPHKIDRPCLFYAKQNDMNFRGDFSILMQNNVPKPTYHMASIFNHLSGEWVEISGGDDDVCAVAAWDANKRRLSVVMVNYRFHHAMRRHVQLKLDNLPDELKGGTWRESIVDATHSNVWHDAGKADLFRGRTGRLSDKDFTYEATLGANSITLIEFDGR